jgi:hypothetical protein
MTTFRRAIIIALALVVTGRVSDAVGAQSAPAVSDTTRMNNATVRRDSVQSARGYSLLNPVPTALLRGLSIDESPYTVDAGHLQLEMGMLSFTDDRRDGARSQSFSIGAFRAKVGISHDVDVHVITELLSVSRLLDAGVQDRTSLSGVGDVTVRVKFNVWGNDSGATALAIVPFVTVPTNTHGLGLRAAEGGVLVPVALDVGGGWGLGLVSEFDVLRRDGRGYHLNVIQVATLGHDLFGPVAGFIEGVGALATDARPVAAVTGNGGLTIGLSSSMQLDVGANVGLNRHAERLSAFIKLAKRY